MQISSYIYNVYLNPEIQVVGMLIIWIHFISDWLQTQFQAKESLGNIQNYQEWYSLEFLS